MKVSAHPPIDGRSARRDRNRAAVIELFNEGLLDPDSDERSDGLPDWDFVPRYHGVTEAEAPR